MNGAGRTGFSPNTGASAKDRLFKKHHFEGEVIPGQQYIIADDVSTTGATGYYLARYITAHGGIVVGNVQLGLTPRGVRDPRTKRRAMVGDEQTLAMSDATRKALLKKADHATLNRAVENLGIAYDWRTLTDALARSLASNWKADFGRVPKGGADDTGGDRPGRPGSDGNLRGLWAFPGEKENRGIGDDGKPVLEQGTFFSFSLAPSAVADALRGDVISRIRNPEARVKLMTRISRDVEALRQSLEILELQTGGKRLKKSLKKEGAMRQAQRTAELRMAANEKHTAALDAVDLQTLRALPLHALFARPDSRLHGLIMSEAAARKKHPDMFERDSIGDYDGVEGGSSTNFGGTMMPDQAAQYAYEEHLIPKRKIENYELRDKHGESNRCEIISIHPKGEWLRHHNHLKISEISVISGPLFSSFELNGAHRSRDPNLPLIRRKT